MILKATEKDSVKISEYNGIYSLISCRQGNDGKDYEQWAKYQLGKDKHADKDWPVKVTIGNREDAIELCKAIITFLNSEEAPF